MARGYEPFARHKCAWCDRIFDSKRLFQTLCTECITEFFTTDDALKARFFARDRGDFYVGFVFDDLLYQKNYPERLIDICEADFWTRPKEERDKLTMAFVEQFGFGDICEWLIDEDHYLIGVDTTPWEDDEDEEDENPMWRYYPKYGGTPHATDV